MALHEAGGMVVGGRNIAFKSFDGGDTVVLLDRDAAHGNVGYNDLTTDSAGRIYAGSLGSPVFEAGEQIAGNLYLIDLDGSSRIVGRDVLLTNGLAFSPDGRTLYHADRGARRSFATRWRQWRFGREDAVRANRNRRARWLGGGRRRQRLGGGSPAAAW